MCNAVILYREDLEQLVARAAGQLDASFPNWFARIDLDVLDMENHATSIFGQLDIDEDDLGLPYNASLYHPWGADLMDKHDLNRLWYDQIEARLYWSVILRERCLENGQSGA